MAKEKFIRGKCDDCKHDGLRANLRRLQEAENKLLEYELMERDKTYKDIVHGEAVGFSSLTPNDYYDTWEALKNRYFTGQYELPIPEIGQIGDLIISAVHPQEIPLTPEQEHLLRPSDTREGRRQMELEGINDTRK